MAINEVKQNLRKQEYPYCARDALCRIEVLCCRPGKQVELQMELIAEFVFGEMEKTKEFEKKKDFEKKKEGEKIKDIDKKRELDKKKKRNLTVELKKLQLIEIMSDFFQSPGGSPAVRNALFLSLFPADSPRHKILGNLVSLAITTQNKAVLNAAGIWMQQLGSTSQQSVGLARHLLSDYFVLTPKSIDKLKQLPTLAPHFTANLLTAIGEVYEDKDPPIELLRLISEWIEENQSLLLTPLMDNPPLPIGGIPMTPITPIAGLFRWCILSPLRQDTAENTANQEESRIFYSKVQQLLMDSVLRLTNSGSNKHAISAQHLASTTRLLTANLQNRSNIDTSLRDLAMERLAQAVSAAMSANCIYGNKQELLALLQPLSYQHFLIEWTLQTCTTKAA